MLAAQSAHSCGHRGTSFLLPLSEPLFNRIMCRIYICRHQSLQQNVKPHQSLVSQVYKTMYFILNFFIIFLLLLQSNAKTSAYVIIICNVIIRCTNCLLYMTIYDEKCLDANLYSNISCREYKDTHRTVNIYHRGWEKLWCF